jgi:hypothetical protein
MISQRGNSNAQSHQMKRTEHRGHVGTTKRTLVEKQKDKGKKGQRQKVLIQKDARVNGVMSLVSQCKKDAPEVIRHYRMCRYIRSAQPFLP